MNSPIGGAFRASDKKVHRLGPMQTIEFPMHRHAPGEEVDYVIVGVGSAGGVLLQRLARAGFKVLGMEAAGHIIQRDVGEPMDRAERGGEIRRITVKVKH